jgi:hypothetical protein
METGGRALINDTLDFLRGSQISPKMSSTGQFDVYQLAQLFIQTRYPTTSWHHYESSMRAFAQEMSLGYPWFGTETNIDRRRRRAVYLLESAILDQAGMTIQKPPKPNSYMDSSQKLLDTMHNARLVWGQKNGNYRAHQDLLQLFRTDQPFLERNPIHIAGKQAVDQQGNPTDRNLQTFHLSYNLGSLRYVFEKSNPYNGYGFVAVSVKALHWAEVPGRGLTPLSGSFATIHGTELDGADIMLTTQFTGCSFCLKFHNGQYYAAHISPAGPGAKAILDANVLAQQLCGLDSNVVGGDFANAPGGTSRFEVYGRKHSTIPSGHSTGYPDSAAVMYLIGFKSGVKWSIYSQEQHQSRMIRGGRQIL